MAWWDTLADYIPSPRSEEEEALLQHRARQHQANMANLPEGELLPDIAKSAASGARSGLESVAGVGGDINHMVAALASYGAGKAGYDPEAAAGAVEDYSPLSWLPMKAMGPLHAESGSEPCQLPVAVPLPLNMPVGPPSTQPIK